MKKSSILCAIAVLTVASCTSSYEQLEQDTSPITIRAYQEGATPNTKTTVLDGGTQVYWEPNDEVNVFFRGSGSRFISQNTQNVTAADFVGSLNIFTGHNEGDTESNKLWGLYPYKADASSDGYSVTTTLPANQTGRAGSFAKNHHITLACSNSLDLAFYNVTGGLRLSFTQEGIKNVSFEGNNGELLAGTIKLAFKDGVPAILDITNGKTILTLSPPDGDTFKTGEWYYFEAIPVTLSKGFKIVFRKDGETAMLSSSSSITINRGRYGSVADADKGLIFSSGAPISEAVDFGLPSGVKWATCNVGASAPEEYGDYFAWGDTSPYYEDGYAQSDNPTWKKGKEDGYWWTSDKWNAGRYDAFLKYNTKSANGIVDNKTQLELQDDAARANWGEPWRMPTVEDWNELIANTSFKFTDNYNGTGVAGVIIYGIKNGYTDKTIFIPKNGRREQTGLSSIGSVAYCWSSTLYDENPRAAFYISFNSTNFTRNIEVRFYGLAVRPVVDN